MFSRILERLEEERKTAYRTYERFEQNVDLGRAFGLEKATEIVWEVAKEYETCRGCVHGNGSSLRCDHCRRSKKDYYESSAPYQKGE